MGAVYGSLIAWIAAVVLDILASGAVLSPQGEMPSWYDSVRFVGLVVMVSLGLAWGVWRAQRSQANAKDDAS